MLSLVVHLIILLLTIVSSRIYEVKISVADDYEWRGYNNASVYFILTTSRDGDFIITPTYIIEDGLPNTKIYSYSLLLDDIGEPHAMQLIHTDANMLCIDWISVDDQNATNTDIDYDCRSDEYYDCRLITAYFASQAIVHSHNPLSALGCNYHSIVALDRGLLREYVIEITLSTSHNIEFYDSIGFLIEGFVFDSYYTPYYNLSYSPHAIYSPNGNYDKIELSLVTYDITPIQSLLMLTSSTDLLCIKRVQISVTNNEMMNVDQIYDVSQCVLYPHSNVDSYSTGCNILFLDFINDKSFRETQLECDIKSTSFTEDSDNRADSTKYTLSMQVSDGTDDYIFYQMEGYFGGKTECFNTAGYQLSEGESVHKYPEMKNVGNPKKLYLLHDRNDDICIDSLSVHNSATNDTITHQELMCSHFLYNESANGGCNVITINFQTNSATNNVYVLCPFDEICEFGLYEPPYVSISEHAYNAILIVFGVIGSLVICSLIFGYKCLWCNCVYFVLLNMWDPFVDKVWNVKCGHMCGGKCACNNSEDMQHNLCCYCCGCNYCNPFSIHRRRMDKKNSNSIAMQRRKKMEAYDTEEADTLNLNTSHGEKYDMNSMGAVDLGDGTRNAAGNGHKVKGDEAEAVGDVAVDFDDSDSTELQLKDSTNKYSSLNVEDAPITMGMYDDDTDNIGTAVVDYYDNPDLR